MLIKDFQSYDKRWKHMQIPDIRKPFVRIEVPSSTENLNERLMIHLPGDPFLAENVSNNPSRFYTTGDVLLEDPPNSGQYLVLGRQDDILVHVNGEKTSPLSMEEAIRSSALIEQVAIVGHNKLCPAALIQLNHDEASKYSSNEIEEKIWQAVVEANKQAPSHSHIVQSLVKILPAHEIFPITHEGNLMRRKVSEQYSALIESMYDRFLNEKQQKPTVISQSKQWTKESIKEYMATQIRSLIGTNKEMSNSQSIFEFGVDSLRVIELRNLICQEVCDISKQFLYEYSSIDQMAEALIYHLHSNGAQQQTDDPQHYKLTEDILQKYIEIIRKESNETNFLSSSSERVFIVTGANSSLGNFVIRDLLRQSPKVVKRVYCLLRGSNTEQRLFQSFNQRQLHMSMFQEALGKRLIILPHSMNLAEEHLGQTKEIYDQLQSEGTDLIHSAWKMNFNQTIKDFEHDCVRGVYYLLKLARPNCMQFHFVSSIASVGSGVLSNIKEEPLPRDPRVALPQGYGQSKYIGEHLCLAAMDIYRNAFLRFDKKIINLFSSFV